MRFLAVVLLLFSSRIVFTRDDDLVFSIASGECASDKIEVTFIRKTAGFASNELFQVFDYDSSEPFYQSWSPSSNKVEMRTECIPRSRTMFYAIVAVNLTSSSTYNYWDACSTLEIVGPYGNRVFKTLTFGMTYLFSLLAPMDTKQKWYWTTEHSSSWYTESVSDWEFSTTDLLPESSKITHYFRKTLPGDDWFAAYEFQFWYKHGIIAYLDGVEIYRDNILPGVVTPTTLGGHAYTSYAFRGAIRNGFEMSEQHMLAVEIHAHGEKENLSFDGWLAGYIDSADMNNERNCHPIPLTALTNENAQSDMVFGDMDLCTAFLKPITLGTSYFTYTTVTAAQITSWYINGDSSAAITQFKVRQKDWGTDTWSDYGMSGIISYLGGGLYERVDVGDAYQRTVARTFQLQPTAVSSPTIALADIIPVICSRPYELERPLFNFSAILQMDVGVEIDLPVENASSFECAIQPALPAGLSLVHCGLQGTPTEPLPETRFTIFFDDLAGTRSMEVRMTVRERESGGKGENKDRLLWVVLGLVCALVVLLLVVVCYMCCACGACCKKRNQRPTLKKKPKSEVIANGKQSTHPVIELSSSALSVEVPRNSMMFPTTPNRDNQSEKNPVIELTTSTLSSSISMNPSMNLSMNDSVSIGQSMMDNPLTNSSLEGNCIDLPPSIPELEYSVGGYNQKTESIPSSVLYSSPSPNSSLNTSFTSSINASINASINSPSKSLHQSTYTAPTSPQTSPSSHALDPPAELTSSRVYAGNSATPIPAIMRKRSIAEPIPLVSIPLPPPMEEVDLNAPVFVIHLDDEN